jgi:BolA family transcriptional regulator, general stress-responsive regulator
MTDISELNQQRIERMHALLAQLEPSLCDIIDESHLHAGHAGAKSGKGHFRLIIRSPQFAELRKIQQHQLVYKTLGTMMSDDIHALSIDSDS